MTTETAQRVIDIYNKARLKIAQVGVVPTDYVAEAFGVTRGEGLSMYHEARKILDDGHDFIEFRTLEPFSSTRKSLPELDFRDEDTIWVWVTKTSYVELTRDLVNRITEGFKA